MGSLAHLDHSLENAMIEALDHRGVVPDDVRQVLRNAYFADELAAFFIRGRAEPESHRLARKLLGQRFVGPVEWGRLFGVRFYDAGNPFFWRFPYPDEILRAPDLWNPGKQVWETHFAYLGVQKIYAASVTVEWWKNQPPCRLETTEQRMRETTAWKQKTCDPRWYLLRTVPVRSGGRPWAEQMQELEAAGYELPTLVEAITGLLLYLRVMGSLPDLGSRIVRVADCFKSEHFQVAETIMDRNLLVSTGSVTDEREKTLPGVFSLFASRKLPS